jgi:ankyrin repeat protein
MWNVTALYAASNKGHLDIVRLLLDHNADPNVKCELVFYSLKTSI